MGLTDQELDRLWWTIGAVTGMEWEQVANLEQRVRRRLAKAIVSEFWDEIMPTYRVPLAEGPPVTGIPPYEGQAD